MRQCRCKQKTKQKLNNIKNLFETAVVAEVGIEIAETVVGVNFLAVEIAVVVAGTDSAVAGTGTDSVAVEIVDFDFLQLVELTVCVCSSGGTPVVFSTDPAENFGIEKTAEIVVVAEEQIAAVAEEQTVVVEKQIVAVEEQTVAEEQIAAVVEEQTVVVVEEQIVAVAEE